MCDIRRSFFRIEDKNICDTQTKLTLTIIDTYPDNVMISVLYHYAHNGLCCWSIKLCITLCDYIQTTRTLGLVTVDQSAVIKHTASSSLTPWDNESGTQEYAITCKFYPIMVFTNKMDKIRNSAFDNPKFSQSIKGQQWYHVQQLSRITRCFVQVANF